MRVDLYQSEWPVWIVEDEASPWTQEADLPDELVARYAEVLHEFEVLSDQIDKAIA